MKVAFYHCQKEELVTGDWLLDLHYYLSFRDRSRRLDTAHAQTPNFPNRYEAARKLWLLQNLLAV